MALFKFASFRGAKRAILRQAKSPHSCDGLQESQNIQHHRVGAAAERMRRRRRGGQLKWDLLRAVRFAPEAVHPKREPGLP